MTRIKSPILLHPHAATCSEGDNILVVIIMLLIKRLWTGPGLGDVDMLTSSISAQWNIHYFTRCEGASPKVAKCSKWKMENVDML